MADPNNPNCGAPAPNNGAPAPAPSGFDASAHGPPFVYGDPDPSAAFGISRPAPGDSALPCSGPYPGPAMVGGHAFMPPDMEFTAGESTRVSIHPGPGPVPRAPGPAAEAPFFIPQIHGPAHHPAPGPAYYGPTSGPVPRGPTPTSGHPVPASASGSLSPAIAIEDFSPPGHPSREMTFSAPAPGGPIAMHGNMAPPSVPTPNDNVPLRDGSQGPPGPGLIGPERHDYPPSLAEEAQALPPATVWFKYDVRKRHQVQQWLKDSASKIFGLHLNSVRCRVPDMSGAIPAEVLWLYPINYMASIIIFQCIVADWGMVDRVNAGMCRPQLLPQHLEDAYDRLIAPDLSIHGSFSGPLPGLHPFVPVESYHKALDAAMTAAADAMEGGMRFASTEDEARITRGIEAGMKTALWLLRSDADTALPPSHTLMDQTFQSVPEIPEEKVRAELDNSQVSEDVHQGVDNTQVPDDLHTEVDNHQVPEEVQEVHPGVDNAQVSEDASCSSGDHIEHNHGNERNEHRETVIVNDSNSVYSGTVSRTLTQGSDAKTEEKDGHDNVMKDDEVSDGADDNTSDHDELHESEDASQDNVESSSRSADNVRSNSQKHDEKDASQNSVKSNGSVDDHGADANTDLNLKTRDDKICAGQNGTGNFQSSHVWFQFSTIKFGSLDPVPIYRRVGQGPNTLGTTILPVGAKEITQEEAIRERAEVKIENAAHHGAVEEQYVEKDEETHPGHDEEDRDEYCQEYFEYDGNNSAVREKGYHEHSDARHPEDVEGCHHEWDNGYYEDQEEHYDEDDWDYNEEYDWQHDQEMYDDFYDIKPHGGHYGVDYEEEHTTSNHETKESGAGNDTAKVVEVSKYMAAGTTARSGILIDKNNAFHALSGLTEEESDQEPDVDPSVQLLAEEEQAFNNEKAPAADDKETIAVDEATRAKNKLRNQKKREKKKARKQEKNAGAVDDAPVSNSAAGYDTSADTPIATATADAPLVTNQVFINGPFADQGERSGRNHPFFGEYPEVEPFVDQMASVDNAMKSRLRIMAEYSTASNREATLRQQAELKQREIEKLVAEKCAALEAGIKSSAVKERHKRKKPTVENLRGNVLLKSLQDGLNSDIDYVRTVVNDLVLECKPSYTGPRVLATSRDEAIKIREKMYVLIANIEKYVPKDDPDGKEEGKEEAEEELSLSTELKQWRHNLDTLQLPPKDEDRAEEKVKEAREAKEAMELAKLDLERHNRDWKKSAKEKKWRRHA